MHAGRLSRHFDASLKKLTGRLVPTALMLALMGACIVAIWLRNRDVLRDLNDYSMVITAAGKIEAGLKPYSDVRSPIQSSTYLLNYGAEWLFGRNYLALTLGGLVQAFGGALLVRGMLRPELGRMAATLVALAVSLAGLIQHMVSFYNPVGILCLSVVLLGLAVEPALWPVRSWRTVAVWAALFLGGDQQTELPRRGARVRGPAVVCGRDGRPDDAGRRRPRGAAAGGLGPVAGGKLAPLGNASGNCAGAGGVQ
ncbi:MAG TPA: hypothetical protein VKC51_01785, partial [Lacunisphaera sp.]|nr:hypothetical protein [Lacunisphaera sp.]